MHRLVLKKNTTFNIKISTNRLFLKFIFRRTPIVQRVISVNQYRSCWFDLWPGCTERPVEFSCKTRLHTNRIYLVNLANFKGSSQRRVKSEAGRSAGRIHCPPLG